MTFKSLWKCKASLPQGGTESSKQQQLLFAILIANLIARDKIWVLIFQNKCEVGCYLFSPARNSALPFIVSGFLSCTTGHDSAEQTASWEGKRSSIQNSASIPKSLSVSLHCYQYELGRASKLLGNCTREQLE